MKNIIFISGTPTTGKTTISEILADNLNYPLIKINDLAIENNLVLGTDEDRGYKIIDITALDELLKGIIEKHENLIVEGHLSHLCSNADKVIILRCRPEILEKRLKDRGYSKNKIRENLEAEALGVCFAESYEKYPDNTCELDCSYLSIDEAVSILTDVILNGRHLSSGEIDFTGWLLNF